MFDNFVKEKTSDYRKIQRITYPSPPYIAPPTRVLEADIDSHNGDSRQYQ